MNNSVSPVSFQGNIVVTTWKRGEYVYKNFPTTEAQDRLIQTVARDMAAPEEVVTLSKRNAKFFHSLLEYITGAKIKNVKNEKALFHNGKDQVEFADHNARLVGGVKVELNY